MKKKFAFLSLLLTLTAILSAQKLFRAVEAKDSKAAEASIKGSNEN